MGILESVLSTILRKMANGGNYKPNKYRHVKDYWNNFQIWISIQIKYRHSGNFQYFRRKIDFDHDDKIRSERESSFDPPSYDDIIEICKELKRLGKNANDEGFEEWLENIGTELFKQDMEICFYIRSGYNFSEKRDAKRLIEYLKKQPSPDYPPPPEPFGRLPGSLPDLPID